MSIQLSKLKEGDIVGYPAFYKVTGFTQGYVVMQDDKGTSIRVGTPIVENDCQSADHYSKEEAITASDMADLFRSTRNTVMSVCFHKKPKESLIANETAQDAINVIREKTLSKVQKEMNTKITSSTIGEVNQAVEEGLEEVLNQMEKVIKSSTSKALKKHIKGEERIMRGRHYGKFTPQSRILFYDMEEEESKKEGSDYDPKWKQVDPRTIQWMIFDDTRYILKK